MRHSPSEVDPQCTGGVPLPKFCQPGKVRSPSQQVITPNCLQSASSCAVFTKQYQVRCPALCEGSLAEIEFAVGQEEASPQEILTIVKYMSISSTHASEDQRFVLQIDTFLGTRWGDVASTQGGTSRLRSRLFAQWRHYAFPLDCLFPHKVGAVVTSGVEEFNGHAEDEEMAAIAVSSRQNLSEPPVNERYFRVEVVVEPYNAVLSSHQLVENADECM